MNLVNDEQLRGEIVGRMNQLGYKQSFIIKDAEERKFKIDASRLSKYLKGKKSGMTEEQVLWLATRLNIDIVMGIGIPTIKDGKITLQIAKYNEIDAIRKINNMFGRGK
jgi:hypothetical protein